MDSSFFFFPFESLFIFKMCVYIRASVQVSTQASRGHHIPPGARVADFREPSDVGAGN